jgi:hypothetical protein
MKKLSVTFTFLFALAVSYAQNQFTNFGNLQTFSNAQVTFFGDFVNNGTITDNGLSMSFAGSSSQSISGTSITTIRNLVVNASASGISMQGDLIISNTINLTAGPLNLNSRTLTINNDAATAIARTSGYIVSEQTNNSGKLKWNIGTNTSAHTFPFGTTTGIYTPVTLTITAGDIGNVTVSTYPTGADNKPYPATPVAVTNVDRFGGDNSANVVDRFWQIDKDGPSGTATLSFTATSAEVGSISALQAQRWNSSTSTWDAPIAGQTSSANGTTVSGITSFSPWTLSGNNQALPIELLGFTAKAIVNEVELNWKTASEINNDYFTIQRSKDGQEFSDIAKVYAAATDESIKRYNYLDLKALPGKSYYRLKQTDFDGKYKYSDTEMVRLDESEPVVTAFPNPVTAGELSLDFQFALESPTAVTVYNLLGKIVFSGVIDEGVRIYKLNLTNSPTGVYMIKTFNSTSSFQQSIVLK